MKNDTNEPPDGYIPPGYYDEYSGDRSPCHKCELHMKGYEKGAVCFACGKRIKYVVGDYSDVKTVGNDEPANDGSGFKEYNFSW